MFSLEVDESSLHVTVFVYPFIEYGPQFPRIVSLDCGVISASGSVSAILRFIISELLSVFVFTSSSPVVSVFLVSSVVAPVVSSVVESATFSCAMVSSFSCAKARLDCTPNNIHKTSTQASMLFNFFSFILFISFFIFHICGGLEPDRANPASP